MPILKEASVTQTFHKKNPKIITNNFGFIMLTQLDSTKVEHSDHASCVAHCDWTLVYSSRGAFRPSMVPQNLVMSRDSVSCDRSKEHRR